MSGSTRRIRRKQDDRGRRRRLHTYSGVFVRGTGGDWTIRDTRFATVGGDGVVSESSGDWTGATVVVVRSGADGVDASGTTGDWTVRNTEVRRSNTGVKAIDSGGNWTVTDLMCHHRPVSNKLSSVTKVVFPVLRNRGLFLSIRRSNDRYEH